MGGSAWREARFAFQMRVITQAHPGMEKGPQGCGMESQQTKSPKAAGRGVGVKLVSCFQQESVRRHFVVGSAGYYERAILSPGKAS